MQTNLPRQCTARQGRLFASVGTRYAIEAEQDGTPPRGFCKIKVKSFSGHLAHMRGTIHPEGQRKRFFFVAPACYIVTRFALKESAKKWTTLARAARMYASQHRMPAHKFVSRSPFSLTWFKARSRVSRLSLVSISLPPHLYTHLEKWKDCFIHWNGASTLVPRL